MRILGRRYPLTDTFYKYLDIGVRIGSCCHVELALGDTHGNEIQFSMAVWKDFLRNREDILRNFANSGNAVRVGDINVEFCQFNGIKLAKLSNSAKCIQITKKTMTRLFDLEYCIDHMYSWLSENLNSVQSKYCKFMQIISTVTDDFAKAILEHADFECHSLIDTELLALGLDVMLMK